MGEFCGHLLGTKEKLPHNALVCLFVVGDVAITGPAIDIRLTVRFPKPRVQRVIKFLEVCRSCSLRTSPLTRLWLPGRQRALDILIRSLCADSYDRDDVVEM